MCKIYATSTLRADGGGNNEAAGNHRGMRAEVITLDPAQTAALRGAATESIAASGAGGTGKSTLAMAIAVQTAAAGRSCLLVGKSTVLDSPSPFRLLSQVHPVLFQRAHFRDSAAPNKIVSTETDPLAARAGVDPFAARTALALLRRVRDLVQIHGLTTSEIEEAGGANQPVGTATRDLAAVVVEDATRLADQLWSGNARAGRSLSDVVQALEGGPSEVPANEHIQGLIGADDREFELQLGKMRAARREERDEQLASAVVSRLKRPIKTEKTVAEYRQHADWMIRVMAEAIDLVRKHGNLQAAMEAQPDAEGAKAVSYFIRMRPQEGAADALRQFQAALRDYQQDSRSLEPLLRRFGSRTLQSLQKSDNGAPIPAGDPAVFSQRIREVRAASRSLPSRIAQLRPAISPAMADSFENSPLESALTVLDQAGPPGPREKSVDEARQLRELFTQTGFGDPLAASADFEARMEAALFRTSTERSPSRPAERHHAPVLDLLLDVVGFTESKRYDAWPSAVVRARGVDDVLEIARAGRKFDAIVVDDAEEFASEDAAFAACSSVIHRIGQSGGEGAFSLRTPHLQQDAELADAALGQPGRWLGSPNGIGVIVRAAPRLSAAELETKAAELIKALQDAGFDAAAAASDRAAVDYLVTSVADLRDEHVPALARQAKKGVIVLCHSDQRTRIEHAAETKAALQAESLGWRVLRSALEGTIVEKGGRAAVIVEEPQVIDEGTDASVADTTTRLTEMGWRPVVDWAGSERDPGDLARLLEERAVSRHNGLVSIIQSLDLTPPPASPDDAPPEGDGSVDLASPEPPSAAAPEADRVPSATDAQYAEVDAIAASAEETAGTDNIDIAQAIVPAFPVAHPAAAPRFDSAPFQKLRVAPRRLDDFRLSVDGQRTALPHVARLVPTFLGT